MTLLRLRYLLTRRGRTVAVALLVLGVVLLGVAGAVYATPPTTEVTSTTSEQTVSVTPTTRATVVGESPLYERGATLRNQPVYLQNATQRMTLSLASRLPAANSSRSVHVAVVYTATRDGETFWRRTDAVPTETHRDGPNATTNATIRVASVRDRLRAFEDAFGAAATVSADVRVSVTYAIPGHRDELHETYPLTLEPGYYALKTAPLSRTYREQETHTVTVPKRSHLAYLGPGAGGVVSLLAGAAVAVRYGRRRDGVAGPATRVHHRRYAEWISVGSVPEWCGETVVDVETLPDLVDVAIDTRNRVIHDADREKYFVLADGVRYRYVPPDRPEAHD